MDEDGARFDSGFDDNGPFRVTPEAGGVSLESALRDYGPAAIDDLIPRLRAIAQLLDAAHAAGQVHGALHPSKVIVHDDATSIVAGSMPISPYAAPETADGTATPSSDQYALAAIAYEWLFGRPIERPADRPIEVRTMPGVDRVTLSKAFTRALAPKPAARFASCSEFCNAVAAAVVPELPLLAFEPADDPVSTFVPEHLDRPGSDVDDLNIVPDKAQVIGAPLESEREDAFRGEHTDSDFDAIVPIVAAPAAVPLGWEPDVSPRPSPPSESQRFGGWALILAALVGAIFGFAGGYMARPRALQGGAVQEIAQAKPTENQVWPVATPEAPAPRASVAPSAPSAPSAPRTPRAQASNVGRLLVRSTPSGASVSVDGVAKGVTPLALRGLDLGTRSVVITRRGSIAETRRVVLTNARPSRSLDVRLAAAEAVTPRPSTPATIGKPASATGGLTIDSRPSGAAVTINGKPGGNTPLTINDLLPGEYRILMAMPGYRNFDTTVRVVAGERVRAAASLTALEQQ